MARPPKPEGASWITPYVIVKDIDKAATFYQKAFYFETLHLAPGEDGTTWHGEMRYKGQMLMFGKEGAYGCSGQAASTMKIESPISLYLYCEDVDSLYRHAVASGAKPLAEPETMFWGDRMCRLGDLDGYVWCFATNVAEHQ